MRLVLDTNVVASALLWGGAPRLLLQAARDKHALLFTSTPLLAELSDILARRKFETKIAASMCTIDQLVDGYAALSILVKPTATARVAPDPDDDVVIGTALAAQADWIVTGDLALLSVAKHKSVRLVSVSEAVQLIHPA